MKLKYGSVLLTFVVWLYSAPAQAQTHYCDTVQPTAGTAVAGSSVTLRVCDVGTDKNQNPTTITGWAVYDNGVRTTPTLVKGTTSTVSGKTDWSLIFTAPSTASVHTYQAAAINSGGEGDKSSPFVLTVNLPLTVPAAPTNLTVR